MSEVKEPCFFASDFDSPKYPKTETCYLNLFRIKPSHKVVGESTTTYLYSKYAAAELAKYNPNAKIVMMLRNPADLAISLHAQRLKEGDECIPSFEEAWKAEKIRKQGKKIPLGFPYPKEYLFYSEIGMYSEQVARYFKQFDKKNIMIIIFENFKKNPSLEYKRVCEFLGVSTSHLPDFKQHNPGRTPKSIYLHRMLRSLSPIYFYLDKKLSQYAPKKIQVILHVCARKIWGVNMRHGKSPVPSNVIGELRDKYKDDIQKLISVLEAPLVAQINSYWDA